jgi:uncharacterized protein YdeI (BOF family)
MMRALPVFRAAVIAVALCSLPVLALSQETPTADQSQDTMQKQDNQQTFVGRIAKDGDIYVLKDETSNVTYKLDDQDKAKENEGKTVTINGSLDSSTNTIRMSTLQPNG